MHPALYSHPTFLFSYSVNIIVSSWTQEWERETKKTFYDDKRVWQEKKKNLYINKFSSSILNVYVYMYAGFSISYNVTEVVLSSFNSTPSHPHHLLLYNSTSRLFYNSTYSSAATPVKKKGKFYHKIFTYQSTSHNSLIYVQ